MNVHLILLPIPKDYIHLKKSLSLRILQRLEQIHLVFIHQTEIPFFYLDLNLKKKISVRFWPNLSMLTLIKELF